MTSQAAEWASGLPRGWSVQRLQFSIELMESGTSVNAVDVPAEPHQLGVLKTSAVYTRAFRHEENKAVVQEERDRVSCALRTGAIVVSRMNTPDLVGAAGLVREAPSNIFLPDRLWQVVLAPEVCVPGYVHWFMCSQVYVDQIKIACSGSSSSMQNLSQDQFRNFQVPRPRLDEQIAIASYLDAETARIDGLIGEKQRLLQLLGEQKRMVAESVIAPAPEGREAKLGYFVDLLSGYAFASENFSQDQTDVPLLRGVNVAPGAIRWEDGVFWPKDQTASLERFRLKAGDVVFGMDRPWISSGTRVALVDEASAGALLLQRVCRIRGGDEISNRFIYYVIVSDKFRQSIEFELSGISVPHISPEQITRFRIPLVSLDEQRLRCDAADSEIQGIDGLIALTLDMIDVLQELRAATITDAVLGRIDVRPPEH